MLILACLLLFVAYCGYHRFQSYFAPAVISPASWGMVLLLYSILEHGMFEISVKGIVVIALWNFFLLLGFYFFYCTTIVRRSDALFVMKSFNPWIRDLYYMITILGLFPTLYISYKQASSMLDGNFMFNLRMANTGIIKTEHEQGVLAYIYTFAFVSYLIELYSFQKGEKKSRLIILFIINMILALVTMAKSSFLFLLFTSLALLMYKKRISFKKVLLLGVTTFLLMSSIQLLRAGGDDGKGKVVSDMLYSYVLGGVPALDQIVNSKMSSMYTGQNTLVFIDNIQRKLGLLTDSSKEYKYDITEDGYLFTPYPTNVYTMIGPFWLDYSYGFVLFAFIIGALAGYFYKLASSGEKWAVILSAYFSCVLMLQFFGEYIFTNLSYLIQLVLLSLLAYKFPYVIKWHKSTSSLPHTTEKNILELK